MTLTAHPAAHRTACLLLARPLALRRDLVASSYAVLEGALAARDDQPTLLARIAKHVGLGAKRAKTRASRFDAGNGESRSFGSVESGVAVISVDGPLLDHACVYYSWYDDEPYVAIDGYDRIGDALEAALAAPDVTAVVFKISSPGGLVSGCFELCARIAALRAASPDKPVITYLADHAYSAAYAIGCAAQGIIAPQLGGCGSIGVLAVHESYAEFLKNHGVATTFIESHRLKSAGDPAKPLDPEAEAMIQAHVDAAADVFTAHVADCRGLSTDEVDAFEAGWFTAEAALGNGLIDAIGTWEEVLEGLQADPAAFLASLETGPARTTPDDAPPEGAPSSTETDTMQTQPKKTAVKPKAGSSAQGAAPKRTASTEAEGGADDDAVEGETDDEEMAEGGVDDETADDTEKTDESAKIAASAFAQSHPKMALAAISSGQTLKQFEASCKAAGGTAKNRLDTQMANERRLGPDAQRRKAPAASINPSEIYARRRAASTAGRTRGTA